MTPSTLPRGAGQSIPDTLQPRSAIPAHLRAAFSARGIRRISAYSVAARAPIPGPLIRRDE